MRDRFGERHDAASADRKLVGRAQIGAAAKADCVTFAAIGRRGRRTGWAAARETGDWFDGADAAAHEWGDEAETQKGEEAGEGHALPGKAGDGDFTDASLGQGSALGAGRSGRGVSDGTTATLACVPLGCGGVGAVRGGVGSRDRRAYRAENRSGCDDRIQGLSSVL